MTRVLRATLRADPAHGRRAAGDPLAGFLPALRLFRGTSYSGMADESMMNIGSYGILISLYLIGATTSAPAKGLIEQRLTMQGIGSLRIGMPEKSVNKLGLALRDQFPPQNDPDAFACHKGTTGMRTKLVLMFEGGVLTRIETFKNKHVETLSGVRIGMTERDVKRIYGHRLRVEHHFYTDGHYLKLFSQDGRYAMVFETDGKRVTNIVSGRKDSAQYVEGCE